MSIHHILIRTKEKKTSNSGKAANKYDYNQSNVERMLHFRGNTLKPHGLTIEQEKIKDARF